MYAGTEWIVSISVPVLRSEMGTDSYNDNMKKIFILISAILIIPWACVLFAGLVSEEIAIGKGDNSIEHHHLGKSVLMELNGLYKSMDVEEYILGVLPGIISADYEESALEAQAVLIRTNLLKEMEEKGSADAKDLSYSYLTEEERRALFGERNYERYEKIYAKAVTNTAGKVLRQEGSLIMALYHEVSIGKTVSAKEVLGEDISYLQSVESGKDVEAKQYMNIVNYSWSELQEFEKDLGAQEEEGDLSLERETEANKIQGKESETSSSMDIAITESTENGFVKQISINGVTYTGDEVMERYGLSSTNFYVEEIDGGVRFVCLGKGNCMGLSQYGANRMALEGAKMEEIIQHYYGEVSIESYN